MKVPTIRLGIIVRFRRVSGDVNTPVWGVNHRAQTFKVKGEPEWLSIEAYYNPVPNLRNFIIAVQDWDYYYRQSDDPKWFDLGEDYRKALKEMLKNMSEQDRHVIAKIVDIVGL